MSVKHEWNGLSAGSANIIMAAVTLVISILLIQATYRATTSYSQMRESTDNYIQWQKYASDLQVGSDILTEQARCFAETGDRTYLNGYFEEANVTKHRDNAVNSIYAFTGDSSAYQSLVSAMGESVALVLFDLDRFKSINDTYGHRMGDLVLERAARTIKANFRSGDYVCRIGGDEFAVIMIHTGPSSAERAARSVCKRNGG